MKAGMLYRTNLHRLVAEVTPMDLHKGPTAEKKSMDKFNSNMRMARKLGWRTFLHKKNESEQSICRKFTIDCCTALPITKLIVEDCLEEAKISMD